jgi:hypothetical protein
MRDIASLAVLLVGFAALLTVHIALVFGLARKTPRTRALAALVLVPLAPYWGIRERMFARAAIWIAAAATYAVGLVLSQ